MRRRTLAYMLDGPDPPPHARRPGWLWAGTLAVAFGVSQVDAEATAAHPVLGLVVFAVAQPFRVVIDPGHNPKKDRGAQSLSGLWEVEFNERLAAALLADLEALPHIDAERSRTPMESLSLAKRARRIEARAPDLVISLHHDSVHPDVAASCHHGGKWDQACGQYEGFSLFIPTRGPFAARSRAAAEALAGQLAGGGRPASQFHALDLPGEGRSLIDPERGIYAGDHLYLVRTAKRPIVLVEAGFIASASEEKKLGDPSFVADQARWLATAIDTYVAGIEIERAAGSK